MNAAAKKPARLTLPMRCALRALGQAPLGQLSTPSLHAPAKRTLDALVDAGRAYRQVGPGVGREVTTRYTLVALDLSRCVDGDRIVIAAQDRSAYGATHSDEVEGWVDDEGGIWHEMAGEPGRLGRARDGLCGRAVELTTFAELKAWAARREARS